jgi:hypothetical protein
MMRKKTQWLFEPPYSSNRSKPVAPTSTVARKSKFTSAQIRQDILAAQNIAVERQPPSTTIRTERSERARHRDTTQGTHGHHAFPKYLGGLKQQTLAYIPAAFHYLYHQEVDKIVQLPRSGKGYRSLSQVEREAILYKLQAHAKGFDRQHGTNILYPMQIAIRQAKQRGLI